MSMTLYSLSGSPFAWKVQLCLEAKGLAYDIRLLSYDAGDLKKPDFMAVNPRGKVPVLDDDGFVLTESAAIVDYLEDRYGSSGPGLWPSDVQDRATARRYALETDGYLYPLVRTLTLELLMKGGAPPDERLVAQAKTQLAAEFDLIGGRFGAAFLVGDRVSAADFTLYPMLAILRRVHAKRPQYGIGDLMPKAVHPWMGLIEALPYFAKTFPPHWQNP